MDIQTEKTRLRTEIRNRIQNMSTEEKQKQSARICDALRALLPKNPCAVCAYAPLPDEVDIRPLLTELLERNYGVYLPRYIEGTLTFHAIESLEELTPGALAVHEPPHHAPPLDPSMLAVVLVPGRAFDRQGNRLGRGKGGYDRWMTTQRQANPGTQFWGIAFQEQIVEAVPVEEHDQPADRVVSVL
jgi:5-formyltetrahydrofolate cyclo-ligase